MSGPLGAAVLQKVTRYFNQPDQMGRFLAFADSDDRDELLGLVAFYVTQHCARNNVRIKCSRSVVRYSVFPQYRKMVNQYTKAYFSVDRPSSHTSVRALSGMSLPQSHFLFWFISNDIDEAFLPQRDFLKVEMHKHRAAVTKAYRDRQRIRKMPRPGCATVCALMPTAARESRLSPVDVVCCISSTVLSGTSMEPPDTSSNH